MHRLKTWVIPFVSSFLLLSFFSLPQTARGSLAGEVNKANDLYRQGKFDDSVGLYQKALGKDDKSAIIKYNLGTAYYKKGDYLKALEYLQQALDAKSPKIKPQAEYNLGNVLYKSGIQQENSNVDEAIKNLQAALGHYGQTLAQLPNDKDALSNQDFVKKEIERLKQKKQQQQKQSQNQKNQKQQNQDQKNQNQKNQNQKNQNQDQQNQKSQQNQPNEQNAENKKNQQEQDQKDAQKTKQENVQESQKEIDRKQAEDLLEEYKDNEEPKKFLNYMPRKIDERPVLKDW